MPDCTHADAGEARERALERFDDASRAYRNNPWRETAERADNAYLRLFRIYRCPDCGRWREGEG